MLFARKTKQQDNPEKVASAPVDAGDENSPPEAVAEEKAAPAANIDLWQNPRLVKLVSWLLGHDGARLEPEITLEGRDGYAYPAADDIMETAGRTTAATLDALAEKGILIREEYERLLLSPDGFVQLIPVERCPGCDSPRLQRGKMVEHFACGYVGFEEEFVAGFKTVCPKCNKELKLIGTDYRIPGMRYNCRDCQAVSAQPVIKYRCLKTGEIYSLEELKHIWLYAYRLDEACRRQLEFELEPKKRFVAHLHRLGYDVQESVKLQGSSGATHTIDLLATVDDPIARHTVAIGILAAAPGEELVHIDSLFSLDSKIYDIGLKHRIVLAVPGLAPDARKFAERQGIRVYGLEELGALLADQPDLPPTADTECPVGEVEPDFAELGPKGFLKHLLEKKGYRVTENARVNGRSGAEHVLELYAEKDDGIIAHQLAACVILSDHADTSGINEVVQFDTAAYDAGISDKVLITIPRLDKAARQFAEYQHIKVLEAKDLIEFSSKFLLPRTGPTGTENN